MDTGSETEPPNALLPSDCLWLGGTAFREYPNVAQITPGQNGSYGPFQRYLCKNCDHTFNDKTGTIFE